MATDAELMTAIVAGDRCALGALYDRYAGMLFAIGMRILGDRAMAEDVAHDVFMEAWGAARTYDPARGPVRTWLMMRMRSRALDRRKSAAVARRVAQAPVETAGAAQGDGSDAERVHRALAGLPPEQRRVLELAYFEGLSATEIAARVETPVGTVKSRAAAALAKLRERLGEGSR